MSELDLEAFDQRALAIVEAGRRKFQGEGLRQRELDVTDARFALPRTLRTFGAA